MKVRGQLRVYSLGVIRLLFVYFATASVLWSAGASKMISPEPGSQLKGTTDTFTWNVGDGDIAVDVSAKRQGSSDLHSGYYAEGTIGIKLSGLPTDKVVYVTLTTIGDDNVYVKNYIFNDPNYETPEPEPLPNDYTIKINDSGRVAEMVAPTWFAATQERMDAEAAKALSQRIYQEFEDQFDFIYIVSNQTDANNTYSGLFFNVANDIEGLGLNTFDDTEAYGSAGKLQGLIHLKKYNGLVSGPGLHELMHNWGAFIDVLVNNNMYSHWGYSNAGGQLGGWKPGSLEDLGNGNYRAKDVYSDAFDGFGVYANGGNSVPYSRLELYLMGLLNKGQVNQDIKVARGVTQTSGQYYKGEFSADSIDTYTMDDIVASAGARSPNKNNSQKQFDVLYVVLTDSPLSESDWSYHDAAVAQFGNPANDSFSSYNFYEATGGRATLVMDNLGGAYDPEMKEVKLAIDKASTGNVEVSAFTDKNAEYVLQYSSNLINWTEAVREQGSGGRKPFAHRPSGAEKMFYRLVKEEP